ncbi:MAG: sugar phosphate isomerase/epimerase [Archaeoglobaceae archaeon]
MKIGAQPDVRHTPKQAFEFVADNNLNHVEILLDHPLYSLEALSYNELIELVWSYDIELLIHAPATSTNFIAISETMRRASYEEMGKVIYLADKCGAEVVTFHLGWNPAFINNGKFYFDAKLYEEHNEKVLRNELKPFIEKSPVTLALENTIAIEGRIKGALSEILEETDLALTLDVGHFNLQRCDFFIENFERVVNLHVHDNNGKSDEHLALGKGKVELSTFPLRGYKNYLTIETREANSILETRDYLIRYMNEVHDRQGTRIRRSSD